MKILQRVPLWSYREHGLPTCAVMRHAERADSDRWDEEHIYSRLDFRFDAFRGDPPLSSFGERQAADMGSELLHSAAQGQSNTTKRSDNRGDSVFGIVVSSPYMRCVQTAAQVCRAGKLPLLLDNALGEVCNPEILGGVEPNCVLRSPEEAARYCAALGVELRSAVVGQWPKWPESEGAARVRYIQRFLQYLRRSEVTRRNFILVTHGHGVAAMLSTLPAMQTRSIKRVDTAGFFVAHAVSSRDRPGLGKIAETQDVGDDAEATLDWAQHWKVMCSKVKVGRCIDESLMTRIKRWASKSRYSEHQIVKLLHASPSKTCGPSADNQQDNDTFSDSGASTIYFGESERSSRSRVYSTVGVSPPHSPRSKSYVESGSNQQVCAGHGGHSPAKLYCEVGVSPENSPIKPYVPVQSPKQVVSSIESDTDLAIDANGSAREQRCTAIVRL